MKLEAHCAACGRVTVVEVSEEDVSDAVARTGCYPIVRCGGCGGRARVMRAPPPAEKVRDR